MFVSANTTMAVILILICLQLALAQTPQEILSPLEGVGYGPSVDSASANAASIFNSIHSSMVSIEITNSLHVSQSHCALRNSTFIHLETFLFQHILTVQ
jgi:hypothetical protein